MLVTVKPLEPDLWPAFEDLFGRQGACYGCWCTHFRLPPAVRRENDRQRNKDFIRARIETGPPPGLLAFDGGQGGRLDADRSARRRAGVEQCRPCVGTAGARASGRSGHLGDLLLFHPQLGPGRGLSHRLVAAGIDYARERRRALLEACPMDQSRDSRSVGLFVGSTRVFERAGFERVAERKAGRPLMRLVLAS